MSVFDRLQARALTPVDSAALAVFRVMFGVIMVVDLSRYFIAGWIDAYFLTPPFLFRFPGFAWVHPIPRVWLYAVFIITTLAAVGVAVGAAYRLCAWVVVLGHGYAFLLSATHYLNHAYLLELLAVIMACLPAADALSVDAWRQPHRRRSWVPAWAPWLLKAQLSIVYVFGGIAKINRDWLAGEPIRSWLRGRSLSASGWLRETLASEWVVGWFVQGGLWFDLLIVPALIWRRTRVIAVLVSTGFHLTNAYLFNIGVFPWFMLMATTLFFDPSWPRRLPWVGRSIDALLGEVPASAPPSAHGRALVIAIGAWLFVQVVLPLRHHLYPGNVAWTEEGHYLAWRMKLRSKGGSARFIVTAPATGEVWRVDPADELTPWQVRKMLGKPDLVLQYAHHLADRWREEHGQAVEVRAHVNVSLNGRARQLLIDPQVDLTQVSESLWPSPWITAGPETPPGRPRR